MSRKELKKIYQVALEKVKAKSIISDNLKLDNQQLSIVNKNIKLKSFENLYIFGVGKAAFDMAKQCENILGDKIYDGLIISNSKGELNHLTHFQSTHPNVSKKSIEAGNLLIEKISKMTKNDRFIFLLSGGASAMVEKPISGLSFEDFRKISSALLVSGIDIVALNSVRKSISQIKGGKLANFAKAKGDVLVLSDVIGDDINTIGSALMNNGKFKHHIIGNNTLALKEAKSFLKNSYEKTKIVTTTLELNSKKASKYISKKIEKYDSKYDSFCLLFGGETTTVVKGNGKGGRNQELALRLLINNRRKDNIEILCAGSDGIDGNSDATGAFVDLKAYEKIEELKIDTSLYLKNSDSNSLFRKIGSDFKTGISGTNVMDFIIVLKENKDV